MKPYVITIVIVYVLTQACAIASKKNDEENLAKNYHLGQYSLDMIEENPSQLRFSQDDKIINSDELNRINRVIRFEGDRPEPSNKPHFFPITPDYLGYKETDGGKAHLQEGRIQTAFYNNVKSQATFYNEKERLAKQENNVIANTEKYTNDNETSGRVVFEDSIKTVIKEPIKPNRTKSRRKLRAHALQDHKEPISLNPGFNYPGYPYPGKHPGYALYQPGYDGSYQGYGLYPGYSVTEPPRPLINPVVNPGQNDQITQINTKYTEEYSGGASGVPISTGTPISSGYGIQYPGNGKYGYAAYPNSQYGLYTPYPSYQGYPVEVASGSAAGSPTLLKATAGLGPLLSILQSYNSLSSSPLFLFGRAAVLGMTSTGSTITCHRAYPQCPKDPAELVNYLNNHNGGFFRFFGQPGPQKQQNLEQFYNHLAGQTGSQQQTQQINYAYNYGYNNQYPKNNDLNNYRTGDKVINLNDTESDILNDIQGRIQNKPSIDLDNEENTEEGTKWTFPDEGNYRRRNPRRQKVIADETRRVPLGERESSRLKFPDERGPTEDTERDKRRDFIRNEKVIYFQNQNQLNYETKYQTNNAVNKINLQEYVFDYKHNFYVKRPKSNIHYVNNDAAQLVYIVRGNGDPNHPEIVKFKPGQRV